MVTSTEPAGGVPPYLGGGNRNTQYLNLVHRNSSGTTTPHADSHSITPDGNGYAENDTAARGLKQEWADVVSTLKLDSLGADSILISPPNLPLSSYSDHDGPQDYFDAPQLSQSPETDISRTSSTSTKGSRGSDLRHSEAATSSEKSSRESPNALDDPVELLPPAEEVESEAEDHDNNAEHTTPMVPSVSSMESDAMTSVAPSLSAPSVHGDTKHNSNTKPLPLPPLSVPDPISQIPPKRLKNMRIRRMHSMLELADTERSYVGDLEMLVHVFFAQLPTVPFFAEDPRRMDTVVRNSAAILPVHKQFSQRLDAMVAAAGIARTDVPELQRAESPGASNAVAELAWILSEFAPQLEVYSDFCSRHKEALELIGAVEQRGTEWEAYQQRCGDLASTNASTDRTKAKRLLFRDFLIKPVQRLCLYPVVLDMLLRNAVDVEGTQLPESIDKMRHAVEIVDDASRKRHVVLHTEAIASRIELPPTFAPDFLASLGNCIMAGNLDVIYHHATQAPLAMPLPIKYYGCFLYEGFVLIVKVRKPHTYVCRHWLPLAESTISRTDAHEQWIQNGFRLSVRGHHFELIASNPKEFRLWYSAICAAHARAKATGSRVYPCSVVQLTDDSNETHGGAQDPLNVFMSSQLSDATRGRASLSAPAEILLRHKSPPRRAAMDRGMLFSDACMSARALPTNEGVWPKSAVVAQSPGGAMKHIRRLSGTETLSLRVPRSMSFTSLNDLDLVSPGQDTPVPDSPQTLSSPYLGPTQPPPLPPSLPSSLPNSRPTTPPGSVARNSSDERARKEPTGAGARLRRKVRDAYLRSRVPSLDASDLEGAIEGLRIKRNSRTSFDSTEAEQLCAAELHRRKSAESLDSIDQTLARKLLPRSISTLGSSRNLMQMSATDSESDGLSTSPPSVKDVPFSSSPPSRGQLQSPTQLAERIKRSDSLNWIGRSRDSIRKLYGRSDDTAATGEASTTANENGVAIPGGNTSAVNVSARNSTASLPDTDESSNAVRRSLSPQRRLARRFFQQNRMSPMTQGDNAA